MDVFGVAQPQPSSMTIANGVLMVVLQIERQRFGCGFRIEKKISRKRWKLNTITVALNISLGEKCVLPNRGRLSA